MFFSDSCFKKELNLIMYLLSLQSGIIHVKMLFKFNEAARSLIALRCDGLPLSTNYNIIYLKSNPKRKPAVL